MKTLANNIVNSATYSVSFYQEIQNIFCEIYIPGNAFCKPFILPQNKKADPFNVLGSSTNKIEKQW